MIDKSSKIQENKKKVAVTATDLGRIIPKLATKVLLGKVGSNTLLTFVIDLGDGKLQVIETIAIDATLHEGLLKLLQNDLKKKGGEK